MTIRIASVNGQNIKKIYDINVVGIGNTFPRLFVIGIANCRKITVSNILNMFGKEQKSCTHLTKCTDSYKDHFIESVQAYITEGCETINSGRDLELHEFSNCNTTNWRDLRSKYHDEKCPIFGDAPTASEFHTYKCYTKQYDRFELQVLFDVYKPVQFFDTLEDATRAGEMYHAKYRIIDNVGGTSV